SFTCIWAILTISFSLWLWTMKPQSHWTILASIISPGIDNQTSPPTGRIVRNISWNIRMRAQRRLAWDGHFDAVTRYPPPDTRWVVVTRLDNVEGIITASDLTWGFLETFARASKRGIAPKLADRAVNEGAAREIGRPERSRQSGSRGRSAIDRSRGLPRSAGNRSNSPRCRS